MAQYRDRQFDHLGEGLHFLVAAYRDVDGHLAVVAQDVMKCQRRVADGPSVRRAVGGDRHGAQAKDDDASFHCDL
jgi:hypothetical protein